MDFKSNVEDSFKKIRKDIVSLLGNVSKNTNKINFIEQKHSIILNQLDVLNTRLNGISTKLDGLKPVLGLDPALGEVPHNQVDKGRSSMRNRAILSLNPTNANENQHPLVSNGTSSKLNKDTKRAKKIKNQILDLSDKKYLKDVFQCIVEENELCGKTTFYRYIKEMELSNKIIVKLENGYRRIIINQNL